MMNSFLLLAYASLAASRTLLQWLLAYQNFTLDSEDVFYWYKRKKVISMNWFLWQQHKQLKIIEMSEAQPDTYDEEYMHQFQHELTHKIY